MISLLLAFALPSTPDYSFHFVGEGGKLYFASVSTSGDFHSKPIPGFYGEDRGLVLCDFTSAVYQTEKEFKLAVNGEIVKSIPAVEGSTCIGVAGNSIFTKVEGDIYKDTLVFRKNSPDTVKLGLSPGTDLYEFTLKRNTLSYNWGRISGSTSPGGYEDIWSTPEMLAVVNMSYWGKSIRIFCPDGPVGGRIGVPHSHPHSNEPLLSGTQPGPELGFYSMMLAPSPKSFLLFSTTANGKTCLDFIDKFLEFSDSTEFEGEYEIAWAENKTHFIGIHKTRDHFGNDLVDYNNGKITKLQGNVYRIIGTQYVDVK
ncbi:MAG: hypothetical protein KF836_02190 [Fimbriimonadaceae bacterium]|nr:hypothetical protein [Fimbriimonadaceae bacterium]